MKSLNQMQLSPALKNKRSFYPVLEQPKW